MLLFFCYNTRQLWCLKNVPDNVKSVERLPTVGRRFVPLVSVHLYDPPKLHVLVRGSSWSSSVC